MALQNVFGDLLPNADTKDEGQLVLTDVADPDFDPELKSRSSFILAHALKPNYAYVAMRNLAAHAKRAKSS